jgi:hypothetical protein
LILAGLGLCGAGVVAAVRDSRKVEIPAVLDVGEVKPGTHSVDLVIENPTAKPFRVLGARVCCGLESVEPLPMTIPPGESGTLNLKFSCRGESGYEGKMLYKLFVEQSEDLSFTGEIRYRIQ